MHYEENSGINFKFVLQILISNLDMSYKNLSARANCSISLLCAFKRFFSSDVGTYFKSCKQTSKQENKSYTHFQRNYKLTTIFREKATRVLNGFHMGLVSWSSWNLQMLGFFWRGITENPEKKPLCKTRDNNNFKPIYSTGSESIQVTVVGDECFHHCAILKKII